MAREYCATMPAKFDRLTNAKSHKEIRSGYIASSYELSEFLI